MFLRELERVNQEQKTGKPSKQPYQPPKGRLMDRVKDATTTSKKKKVIQEWIVEEIKKINKSEVEDF